MPDPASPLRQVTVPVSTLVLLLTLGTGAFDGIAIVALGDVFASVMTGNLVLIGMGIGTGSGGLLAHVGAALGGYVFAGAAGSLLVHRLRREDEHKVWPGRVTVVLTVQLLLVLALAITWNVLGGEPPFPAQLVILAGAAAAMGMQGAAVRAVGLPVSTTYMTGALTTLIEGIVTRRPFSATERSAISGLLALVAGAGLGGYLAANVPPLAMWLPMATLTVVVVACVVLHRHRRGERDGIGAT
jgi:uncharacterized membrane protein YoaK (UPF0700 family)